MAEGYLRQTALASLGLRARADVDVAKAGAGVWIGESGDRGQLTLRGDGASGAFQEAVKQAIGVTLPAAPNTVSGPDRLDDGPRVIWLGPDEWLVVTHGSKRSGALKALREALRGQHATVTDTSDSRTVIVVSGPYARDTLSKGCSLDLHPRAFTAGACAQTTLARAAVILHSIGESQPATSQFDVYVHWSFAEYLWAWIEDAGGEYGVKVTGG